MRSHYLLLPASLALLGSAPVFSQQDPLTLSAGYSVQTDSNLFRLPSSTNLKTPSAKAALLKL